MKWTVCAAISLVAIILFGIPCLKLTGGPLFCITLNLVYFQLTYTEVEILHLRILALLLQCFLLLVHFMQFS
jgi:hypothetical protein